ncbi:MAG TPA: type II toxin-antitoxin system prevent-host-death family antitoxin [Sphingomicrobium sp.]|nr:type II toxin-antitoxin system prevent-host-death family antitoxin [Sphingomicrobium sp.]
MAQFSVHDAKTNLSKLIAAALAGGEVVIARGSVPAVRLVPVAPRGRRRFGALKGKIAIDGRFHEQLPDDELAGWDLA